jgi:hypothetical protein
MGRPAAARKKFSGAGVSPGRAQAKACGYPKSCGAHDAPCILEITAKFAKTKKLTADG